MALKCSATNAFACSHSYSPCQSQCGTYRQSSLSSASSRVSTELFSSSASSSSSLPEHYFYYTDKEILEMKNLVVSISEERDDTERRECVKDWVNHKASMVENQDHGYIHGRGIRMVHLWDALVIEMGQDIQEQARIAAKERCMFENIEQSFDSEEVYERSEAELDLWCFVDMMVQTKVLMNKLGIPPRGKSEKIVLDDYEDRSKNIFDNYTVEEGIFE